MGVLSVLEKKVVSFPPNLYVKYKAQSENWKCSINN